MGAVGDGGGGRYVSLGPASSFVRIDNVVTVSVMLLSGGG